jgi:diacylglycerol kinase family enzyme
MRSPLFIINPSCGTRSAGRDISRLLARVDHLFGQVAVRYTERRGHAEQLAFAGAEMGHDLIVAVGGDGTFSEVVNGVMRAGDGGSAGTGPTCEGASAPLSGGGEGGRSSGPPDLPAVGLVSIGTGGDFRRTLGIGPGVEASLEALAAGTERQIDVCRAEFRGHDGAPARRYFVNVLSAGVGGLVDRYVESIPSFVGGRAGYYLAALWAVARSRERRILARVTWQGESRDEIIPAYLVAVCNGRWFGGGMDVAPMALPDDGRLEVVTITAPNRIYFLRRVQSVYAGRHLDIPTVGHFPCERVELRLQDPDAEERFLLDVDGDPLGSLPVRIEVVPNRLRVRA